MANLTQLRMLEDLNGFLLVDKPAGLAFSTVVKTVKRRFNLVKVGHGGSLDPLGSGLLILLINDANKFADRLMGSDRAYTGTMRLGLRTNTHDIYGSPIGSPVESFSVDPEKASEVARGFRGDVFQTEPSFCSVRREASASYEVAETGEHKQFLAHVYKFDVTLPDFSLVASKGVLVRTLVNDYGDALGCGAALASLRRTKVGSFSVEGAVPFARLLEMEVKDFPSCVIAPRDASL